VDSSTYVQEFDDGSPDCKRLKYQGSSPDCVALTEAAKILGYAYTGTHGDQLNMIIKGVSVKYKVLD
jgi:hypothetical protein